MKSREELERIKEETLAEIRLRSSQGCPRIVVGMGTCGIAAGARETMLAIIDELRKRRRLDVTISETGCIGLCAKEPIVEVNIPGQPKIVYGNVDPSRARQIVLSHIINHKPIQGWVINVDEKKS
ncbi:MAG: (2Fe-2S) ferredoxin domain-containing protein [Candidatus Fermentithermobacillus carboniphilus]|uniref:(2Fe-2S) ferredoxin domain-containing protein n=1 Tax=Candidatus Fermentithermobacillus carboniphilus TaxID=3085328 RepID=A0AAT9LB84_9FIRM|nr:MAG: (2Fe-2S) ferredoxin domain-containing protein [Candidatus Fermentithermobacillus carboniphilus]